MNGADICHEVDSCPGLYVDAFRGKYLRRTQDPDNAFILTHYHGDHYQNLPRDGKYQGSALIHCTPVTAALLKRVHKVPEMWVIEHDYEQTFSFKLKGSSGLDARITFYDANHCPGACIVLIQLPDGRAHLHTGDMRYHERFKSYPLLREAAVNNKLDIVYLDTTYSHPKHDFVPQEEAVQTIADTTVQLLVPGPSESSSKQLKTLILLSCYSIGKEKVLWEASTRTNQLIYVTEKKFQMLQCVQGHASQEVSSQIIHRCTQDANQSPIHVIPMGLAGEIWPFFRPNFVKCADYAHGLQQGYERVVAFLPTGWAHGSKWNREHAISRKTVPPKDGDNCPIDVEVRLVPYSEHSAFSELVSFVQFLRPRKVIPTVFSDEGDYHKIENRFRNLLDSKRAKELFFRSMTKKRSIAEIRDKKTSNETEQQSCPAEDFVSKVEKKNSQSSLQVDEMIDNQSEGYQSDESVEVVKVENTTSAIIGAAPSDYSKDAASLTAMGFTLKAAQSALIGCEGDIDRAIDRLLCECSTTNTLILPNHTPTSPCTERPHRSSSESKKKRRSDLVAPCKSQISSFFSKKLSDN